VEAAVQPRSVPIAVRPREGDNAADQRALEAGITEDALTDQKIEGASMARPVVSFTL